jgi:hypothetical protein
MDLILPEGHVYGMFSPSLCPRIFLPLASNVLRALPSRAHLNWCYLKSSFFGPPKFPSPGTERIARLADMPQGTVLTFRAQETIRGRDREGG